MKHSLFKEVHNLSVFYENHDPQVKSLKVTSLNNVRARIQPNAGLWSGHLLTFEIRTKHCYPHSPCKVKCTSQILHPNILELDGELCLNVFDEDWSSSMSVFDYISGVIYLLYYPNFEDPLSDYFCIAKEQGRLPEAIAQCASFI